MVASYGQLEQPLLDPSSALYASRPDTIVIAPQVEDVAPALADGFVSLSETSIDREIDGYVRRVSDLLRSCRQHTTIPLLVWNEAPTARVAAGLADASLALSQSEAFARLNHRLAQVCRTVPGAFVFDVNRLAIEVGLSQWANPDSGSSPAFPLAHPR